MSHYTVSGILAQDVDEAIHDILVDEDKVVVPVMESSTVIDGIIAHPLSYKLLVYDMPTLTKERQERERRRLQQTS